MLYLTCTIISRVDLAHYGVSRAKDFDKLVTLSRQKNISDNFLPVCIGVANNVYQDQPTCTT